MSKSQAKLIPLPWDSAHFGFSVGRMEAAADSGQAADILQQARSEGIELVYWQPGAEVEISAELLLEFAGRLVDQKATYQIDLTHSGCATPGAVPGQLRLREYPQGPASAALRELAIEAGTYSRFRRDLSFPVDSFHKLYTTWIERSCHHELADVVFVVEPLAGGDILGMITIAAEGNGASIGLIAVAGPARGQGVGRILMQAAHNWMAVRSHRTARVVTQRDNQAACRLYASCGYRLVEVQPYYHFWPRAERSPLPGCLGESTDESVRRVMFGNGLPSGGTRYGN